MNASRDLLISLALIAVVAGACNEDAASPVAPSAVSDPDTAASLEVPPGGNLPAVPRAAAMNAGTCVSGPGYIRCWHFYVRRSCCGCLRMRPGRGAARRSCTTSGAGFKVHCDKTIVWSGGRRIYRVSPMRPVTIDGERHTCS